MRTATHGAARTWLESGLWMLAVVGLGFWMFAQWSSWNYQREAARQLAATPLAASSPQRRLSAGEPLGHLSVPRLDLDVVVAEGDSAGVLRRAVGHVPRSALPGMEGNVVLAGHRDTFFRSLRETRAGDIIRFATPQKTYTYRVQWTKVVSPTDVKVMQPVPASGDARVLTLITCYPFYYVGPAPQRFVVRALPVDATRAQGAGE